MGFHICIVCGEKEECAQHQDTHHPCWVYFGVCKSCAKLLTDEELARIGEELLPDDVSYLKREVLDRQ